MAILITGGAGYIGSHTMVEFLEAGKDLVCVDNLCNSKVASLERVKQITGREVKFYKVDLLDIDATAATGGNSNKDFYKPVGSQTGYILPTHCREWNITTGIKDDTKGLYLVAKAGESYNYSVFAEASDKYTFAVAYRSKSGAKLSIFVDGVYINDIVLGASEEIATEMIRGIDMATKSHVITVYVR